MAILLANPRIHKQQKESCERWHFVILIHELIIFSAMLTATLWANPRIHKQQKESCERWRFVILIYKPPIFSAMPMAILLANPRVDVSSSLSINRPHSAQARKAYQQTQAV
ncbi:hypothetical protein [Zymobacter sp. IVIA_5232.4 C2]|uniref:hypothetical protein n=1 Tax=Zymobacter sp. IVIA_5232.4 C2 TaxID=3394855 RepID=UPI0039C34D21